MTLANITTGAFFLAVLGVASIIFGVAIAGLLTSQQEDLTR